MVEDLYYGLPPLSSIAGILKVKTPAIDAMVHLFSIIDGVDYVREGLNAEKLGISRLSSEDMITLVT